MSKRSKLIWFILDCLILAILMFLTNRLSYKEGYEECAKDFYKGKMKINLIENADGTKEWKWIK